MQRQSNMSLIRTLSLAMLAIVAILAVVPAAHAQNTIGTITQLTGAANIERGGTTIAAAPNTPVMLHDKIVTQPGASLTITMVDNSEMDLGASTTLTIDESFLANGVGAPSKVSLPTGTMHFLVQGAMKGPTTTFEVHTPNAVGAVRGTEAKIDSSQAPRKDNDDCFQYTDVDVVDGTVNVKIIASGESQDVHAGKHVTVRCGGWLWAGNPIVGPVVGTALGIGIVGGGIVGGIAGAGGFGGGGGGGSPPPKSPKH